MATIQVTICDECERQKTPTVNHWFCLLSKFRGFAFTRMSDVEADAVDGLRHFCSQQCMMKVFGRWMETGSIDKPAPVEAKVEAKGEPVELEAILSHE